MYVYGHLSTIGLCLSLVIILPPSPPPGRRSNRKEPMRAPNAMYGWVNIVRQREQAGGSGSGNDDKMRWVCFILYMSGSDGG